MTQMASGAVSIQREGSTAVVTLDRPNSRNALSPEMIASIGLAFDELEHDETTKSVVITGSGRAFCAGADLATLLAAADGQFERVKQVYAGFLRVLHSPLVTIAAINGPAVGAGMNLALACDLRLAGHSAVFDTRFAQLHVHPGGGHVWMLTRAVGQQNATMACMFGEIWDASVALSKGLVLSVHEDHDLVRRAVALSAQLDDQDLDYCRQLIATLRSSWEVGTHAEALTLETTAQQRSTTLPAFRAGVEMIRSRVSRPRE